MIGLVFVYVPVGCVVTSAHPGCAALARQRNLLRVSTESYKRILIVVGIQRKHRVIAVQPRCGS